MLLGIIIILAISVWFYDRRSRLITKIGVIDKTAVFESANYPGLYFKFPVHIAQVLTKRNLTEMGGPIEVCTSRNGPGQITDCHAIGTMGYVYIKCTVKHRTYRIYAKRSTIEVINDVA